MAVIVGGHWTFSGDPSVSARDEVRFLVTDTDVTDQLLSDEEIDYLLTQHSSVVDVAAVACEQIALQFARKCMSTKVGDLAVTYGHRSDAFAARAVTLRSSSLPGAEQYPAPTAGGISIAAKRAVQDNDDRVPPGAYKGMWDHPSRGRIHG